MAKNSQHPKLEPLAPPRPRAFEEIDRWDPEAAEVLDDLLRALRRKQGFGLFFVQCNPAQGQRVIQAIQKRFPQKRLMQFALNRETETLYGELLETYQADPFEVACVTGVEQAMYGYEDTKRLAGWSSEEIYNYSWKGLPPLLNHLNRQREAFEANLPIALIFLVPSFVIDYFVQRAPDFFDWRSGFFKFTETTEEIKSFIQEIIDKNYMEYLDLSPEERMEKALEIKDKILELGPSSCQDKSKLLREQGRLLELDKNYFQSLSCYERALIEDPNNYNACNSKGKLLNKLERYEEAIEACSLATKIQPESCPAWKNIGVSLQNLNRIEESIKYYNFAINANPKCLCAWAEKGLIYRESKKYKEALESFNKAVELQPKNPYFWGARGDALRYLNLNRKAVESYENSLSIDSSYQDAWICRGIALSNLRRYKEALESHNHALKIKPGYSAWRNKGNTLFKLKRYEEALESCDKSLEIRPDETDTWKSRGDILFKLKRHEEALESYDKSLEINADNFYALTSKARVLCDGLKQYGDALVACDNALKIQPDHYWAWRSRAVILMKLKRREEASLSITKFWYYQPASKRNWWSRLWIWFFEKMGLFDDIEPR